MLFTLPTLVMNLFSVSSVVLQLLNKLDVRKSVRPDGISVCFLKEVSEPIAAPLTKLLINLWKPHQWKCSNVTPVHKGDHVTIQQNFKPISVVPIVAKVFEKIVASQLHP